MVTSVVTQLSKVEDAIRCLNIGDAIHVPVADSKVAKVKIERLGRELFRLSVPFWNQFNHFYQFETEPVLRTLVTFQKVWEITSITRILGFPSSYWFLVVK